MPERADIEKQIADLQSQLDAADTDDEIWIKDPSGHEIKVTGKKATSVLNKFAALWTDDNPENDEPEEDDTEEPETDGPLRDERGYFKSRKK